MGSVRRAGKLAGLALLSWGDVVLELAAFVLLCVGIVVFYPAVLEGARGRSRRTRELVGRWTGEEIPSPYRPAPADPERERDGWYRDGNQLYRRDWWIRWNRRFTWIKDDPATGRELVWQVLNPVVALSFAGFSLVAGPAALRGYARWTRYWLGPRPARQRTRRVRRPEMLGHQFGLYAISLALLMTALVQLVVLIGAPALFSGAVQHGRTIADTFRREAENWTGLRIPRPYLPPPSPPVVRADGYYQYGKRLYDQPWVPLRRSRAQWVLRDRATWRDMAAGLVLPVVSPVFWVPSAVLACWGLIGIAALWIGRLFLPLPVISGWFEMAGLPAVTGTWPAVAMTFAAAAAVLVAMLPAPWLLRLQVRFGRLLLGPTEAALLAQRVRRLDQTRTEVTVAQASELRRIERDLHDGVQSRLVAMGMKLGAVEALIDQDPAAARQLAAELRTASSEALTELRSLVRGIHPPVLSERGLTDAVRAAALDSPLKVEVTSTVAGRVEQPVEACAYFAVCELLGNAAKHGEARRVLIALDHREGLLSITVTDDGRGGADAARGSGLRGIERRLGGFDGRLTLTSPPGGPTEAFVEVPCQLDPPRTPEPSSPKTSTSSATA
ncbi:sensor histidine kinase [Amycolatopsis jiangsuensis]|uniref:histidine kinase n=1 Tax=Amycolatopsis jiangsuensis TaxID=1181879 RepID=A0A840J193_9PSEU|nr:histidine kinase [Amycolatopsis jiangsuensis]MBB4687192.1 signal transduction histidine kinase [Amycolatopsis jiangsuensis]